MKKCEGMKRRDYYQTKHKNNLCLNVNYNIQLDYKERKEVEEK